MQLSTKSIANSSTFVSADNRNFPGTLVGSEYSIATEIGYLVDLSYIYMGKFIVVLAHGRSLDQKRFLTIVRFFLHSSFELHR
jgi:hypothetical protein